MEDILNAPLLEAEQRRQAERRAALEADIARKVQARLFPQSFPPMATIECAARCIPAQHIGGDDYDLVELGRGRIGLVAADISGTGVSGALLMAHLEANFRMRCEIAAGDPARLLGSLNRLSYSNTEPSN